MHAKHFSQENFAITCTLSEMHFLSEKSPLLMLVKKELLSASITMRTGGTSNMAIYIPYFLIQRIFYFLVKFSYFK